MSNVRILPGYGKRDPDAILECAKNADLTDVVILGRDEDGEISIFSSHDDFSEVLWDLMQGIKQVT